MFENTGVITCKQKKVVKYEEHSYLYVISQRTYIFLMMNVGLYWMGMARGCIHHGNNQHNLEDIRDWCMLLKYNCK